MRPTIGAGCSRSDIDPMTALCPMPAGGVIVEIGAGDGNASVRATFTKVARKRLARAKRVTFTLRPGTASRTVVLKR